MPVTPGVAFANEIIAKLSELRRGEQPSGRAVVELLDLCSEIAIHSAEEYSVNTAADEARWEAHDAIAAVAWELKTAPDSDLLSRLWDIAVQTATNWRQAFGQPYGQIDHTRDC